jgi:hypothetical protein
MNNNVFNKSMLSSLSFEDILSLRQETNARSKNFREKYDAILTNIYQFATIQPSDKDVLIADIQLLQNISDDIRTEFNKAILCELPTFKAERRELTRVNTQLALLSQFLGLFFPPISIINLLFTYLKISDIALIKKSKQFLLNKEREFVKRYISKHYKNDAHLLSFFKDIFDKYDNSVSA